MSVKNIEDIFIVDEYNKESESSSETTSFEKTKNAIAKRFPQLSDSDVESIVDIINNTHKNTNEDCELIATAPNSFNINCRSTYNQIVKLINEAKSQIIITGYNISEYFDDFIKQILSKVQKGVLVKMYLNDVNESINNKLKPFIGRFLRVYVYNQKDDKMAASHAKIMSIDSSKSLISSANLSYHGLEGNIEIGVCIKSEKIAFQIKELLERLLFMKVFKEIKQ